MVFPDLSAANVAYKLLQTLGGAKAVGPLLMGLTRPFNVLPRGTDMENVVNVIALTVGPGPGSPPGFRLSPGITAVGRPPTKSRAAAHS